MNLFKQGTKEPTAKVEEKKIPREAEIREIESQLIDGTIVTEITKDNLDNCLNLEVIAYIITSPGAMGMPGEVVIVTTDSKVFRTNYCYGDITAEDIMRLIPSLDMPPESFYGNHCENQKGWYWYGLHSGCWSRVHDSIWQYFTENNTQCYGGVWRSFEWTICVLLSIYDSTHTIFDYD